VFVNLPKSLTLTVSRKSFPTCHWWKFLFYRNSEYQLQINFGL